MFVIKCAGAMAASGAGIDEVERIATWVSKNVTSMGCSLSVCNLPTGSVGDRSIPPGEMEFGLGVHGEPGAYRKKVGKVCDIVKELVTYSACIGQLDEVKKGDEVAVLVNNLGAVTQLEMGVIAKETVQCLQQLGVKVLRFYTGTVLSSLDMKGFSVSLLRIPDGGDRDTILGALDASTEAVGWPRGGHLQSLVEGQRPYIFPMPSGSKESNDDGGSTAKSRKRPWLREDTIAWKSVEAACSALAESVKELDELDSSVGDGDCGTTFGNGAKAVMESRDSLLRAASMSELLILIAREAGQRMGGSSGALMKIFFTSMSNKINSLIQVGHSLDVSVIGQGLQEGCNIMSKYGAAVEGDGTMLDALFPMANAVIEAGKKGESPEDTALLAAEAAQKGSDLTKNIVSKAGRSSYVPSDRQMGIPDPGARAIAIIASAIASCMVPKSP